MAVQVERGIDLVYGGGSIGLMGSVSHAVHAGGRHVMGLVSIGISLPSPSYPAIPPLPFLFAWVLLWWSLHAMALSGPGVCPSGRFVSRHQLTAPKRQPWLQKCQLYFVSQPAVGVVWALHCPLGEQGASHADCIRFTEVEATFRSSFRKASWFHAPNGRVGCSAACKPALCPSRCGVKLLHTISLAV